MPIDSNRKCSSPTGCRTSPRVHEGATVAVSAPSAVDTSTWYATPNRTRGEEVSVWLHITVTRNETTDHSSGKSYPPLHYSSKTSLNHLLDTYERFNDCRRHTRYQAIRIKANISFEQLNQGIRGDRRTRKLVMPPSTVLGLKSTRTTLKTGRKGNDIDARKLMTTATKRKKMAGTQNILDMVVVWCSAVLTLGS